MPEVYYYGNSSASLQLSDQVNALFSSLPLHRDSAVLIVVDSTARGVKTTHAKPGKPMPFIRVDGTVDMSDRDLIDIANHFVLNIDVSIRNGKGIMAFKEKGSEFVLSDLSPTQL